MKFQLYYDNLLVGEIAAPLLHQGTWGGDFLQVVGAQDSPTAHRICDFITFCRDWHVRLGTGASCEASEFDQFSDSLHSGLWFARKANGTVGKIEQAPVFINDEISWRLETEEGLR